MFSRTKVGSKTEPTLHITAPEELLHPADDAPEAAGTEVLSTEGLKLAIGLTWTEVESTKEARRFAGKGNAYLTLDVGGQMLVARGAPSTIGLFAGGALVSKVIDNALIFHKIAEEKYWVCLIKDRVPQPTYDRIIHSTEEAHQAYSAASEIIAVDGKVVGDSFNATKSLQEVLREAKEVEKRELKRCRLTKNGIDVARALASLGLIAAAAAAANFVITERESLRNEERRIAALRSLLQSQQEKEAQERRIAKLKQDYLERFATEQRNFGQQAVALAQWRLCETVRQSLPYTAAGYRPERLTCDYQAGKSSVEWTAINAHTRLVDRALLPAIVNPLDTDGPIVSEFPLDSENVHGTRAQKFDHQAVKMTVLDWSSRHIRSMKFGSAEEVVMRPPAEIKGLPGVNELRLGKKIPIQFNTSNSAEMLSMPWAIELLNQYPISFERIVWSRPTSIGAQVNASSTLYIPQ